MVPRVIFAKLAKNGVNRTKLSTNFAISQCTKKQSASSGPDFYAIFKMVHYISVPKKLTELLSKM